ncbi:hypothetical protein ES703_39903 [subsurface metagenome]
MEHHPQLSLGDFFIVGITEEGQHGAVHPGRWLNDKRHDVLVGLLVKVGHLFAAVFGVPRQVVVAAIGNALQLCPAHGEIVIDVVAFPGVVGQFCIAVGAQAEVLLPDAEVQVPLLSLLKPVIEPLIRRLRPDKILDFHLLELAAAEDKVAGGDFIAEGFP